MLTSAIPPHQAGLAVVEPRCPAHLQARLQRQDPARVTPRHTGRRYRRERVLQDWVLGTAHHDHVQPGHIRRRRSKGIPQHRLPTRPQVQRASGRRSDRHNRHHQHRQRHTPAEPQRPRHQRQARHGHPRIVPQQTAPGGRSNAARGLKSATASVAPSLQHTPTRRQHPSGLAVPRRRPPSNRRCPRRPRRSTQGRVLGGRSSPGTAGSVAVRAPAGTPPGGSRRAARGPRDRLGVLGGGRRRHGPIDPA